MKLFTLATTIIASLFTINALPVIQSNQIVSGKHFDRVVIFIFENQDYDDVHADPYFGSLATKHNGVELTNFFATTHPSQPNYISFISGSTSGTFLDFESNIDRKSIVDLLEAKGISWKSYQQGYTGNCDLSMRIGKYARKHNPFISFTNVQNNPERCAKIVNSDQLDIDISKDQVPQFVFFTPDLDNDGHDTNLTFASNWFQGYLEPRITKSTLNKNTMFVSTWDEARNYLIPNQIQTVLFGPDFKRSSNSSSDNTKYNLYSLLRTIEDNWDLGNLGKHDKDATLINL
ncbi:phosphoesterase family-domain-containing protein [Cunninghamella echinulata]|nr:phosphoesterase family-domain-containing protein [Cunninghamella echinulata]